MANIKSFPNNQDTYIGAEDVMKWLHGRTSGVFAASGNASVTALATPAMAVQISDGTGWMSNSGNDGVVWWNDHNSVNGSQLQIQIDSADGTLDRIDRIIVEWKTTNYVDYPEIKVLKGSKGSEPSAPALTNNSTVRQISLAQISIAAGTTTITDSMITDERLDSSVCGLVTDGIEIDTTTIDNQFQAFLAAIERELQELESGTGVELKKLQFNNTSVAKTAFVSDTTYAVFPYRASVALSGVISTMIPEVIFGMTDAISGIFAPVAESYNGGIYLYASTVPESAITIPTILCWKGNA